MCVSPKHMYTSLCALPELLRTKPNTSMDCVYYGVAYLLYGSQQWHVHRTK